ncbi:Fe-S oxidoreductase [Boudabousia liubingyangii]|nr:Fe-S oxidoreductase [Boudabousia liubingyangii]
MSAPAAVALFFALAGTLVGAISFVAGCRVMYRQFSYGQSAPERLKPVGSRLWVTIAQTLTHRSFKGRPGIRAAHWLVMISFPVLFFTLLTGYGQIVNPGYHLPLLGHFPPYEWLVEFFAWGGLLGILLLFWVRLRNGGILPWRKAEVAELGNRTGDATDLPKRFFGSTRWWAIFVEAVILVIVICVLLLRGLEYAYQYQLAVSSPESAPTYLHFPLTAWYGQFFTGLSVKALTYSIMGVAVVKILISAGWLTVVGLQTRMGIAWHRFLAFINIYARRDPKGGKALGALEPIKVNGQDLTLDSLEDLPEDASLGVRTITDFTWKGLLDFSTCTECGRCQELCPAWATGKPLSPKLFTIALRDHQVSAAAFMEAAAALEEPEASLLEADEVDGAPLLPLELALKNEAVSQEAGTEIGASAEAGTEAGADTAETQPAAFELPANLPFQPHTGDVLGALMAAGAAPSEEGVALQHAPLVPEVITPEALWACTTCGACVEQCPVDIEHVDHIVDLRRHQVLMESAFPKELAGVFRKLEKKQNPYGQAPRKRLEWAKPLDFEVPVIGEDMEDASELDYLFWVGCAGAYDDQAQKTSRAVATLLHLADVKFGVLGSGETCTGDPARRAGNEILFQTLAAGAVETLNEVKAQKIVVTCAHCFNTIAKEFPQLGGHYQVLHHTQLLNQLVREGRLKPVPPKPGEQDPQAITYHDPCYLGRHNQVYAPPRELLGATGLELREMPRNHDRAMCCGGGGARVWMEEHEGVQIATARVTEAQETGAQVVATACPFCTQMLGSAPMGPDAQRPEVKDVSLLMLEAVERGQ